VFARLKDFQEPNHIAVLDLLQQVNFLENFAFAKVILHIIFLDRFNGYLLASELVNSQGDFTESALADELHKLVEVQCCGRKLVVLLDVLFYVLY
jgi:hypothetical protein